MKGLYLTDRYNMADLTLEDDGTLTVIVGVKEYADEQHSITISEEDVKILRNWLNEG